MELDNAKMSGERDETRAHKSRTAAAWKTKMREKNKTVVTLYRNMECVCIRRRDVKFDNTVINKCVCGGREGERTMPYKFAL